MQSVVKSASLWQVRELSLQQVDHVTIFNGHFTDHTVYHHHTCREDREETRSHLQETCSQLYLTRCERSLRVSPYSSKASCRSRISGALDRIRSVTKVAQDATVSTVTGQEKEAVLSSRWWSMTSATAPSRSRSVLKTRTQFFRSAPT